MKYCLPVPVKIFVLSCLIIAGCKKPVDPVAETSPATEITTSSAVLGGTAKGEDLLEVGVCYGLNYMPTIKDNKVAMGNAPGNFQATVTGFAPGNIYYVRAYCATRLQIDYGDVVEFQVAKQPVFVTGAPRDVSESAFTATASVSTSAEILAAGLCYATTPAPTISNSKSGSQVNGGTVQSTITGLQPNTLYYYRPYATVTGGETFYGPERPVRTYLGKMQDIDGNSYFTVRIGNQEWMASNLKSTRFRNGDAIAYSTAADWYNVPGPKYGYYNSSQIHLQKYGAFYDYKTIRDPRNIAPAGWRVPTHADFKVLMNALSLTSYTHSAIRSPEFANGDNSSGFSALAAGMRNNFGTDYYMGTSAGFWTTDSADGTGYFNQGYYEFSSSNSNNRLYFSDSWMSYEYGLNIRCIKE